MLLFRANSTELEIDLLFQHKALMPSKVNNIFITKS